MKCIFHTIANFLIIKSENSEFQLWEYFNVNRHSRNFSKVKFAVWEEDKDLIVPAIGFYQKRLKMNKTVIRVTDYHSVCFWFNIKFLGEIII